jgi:hypothetical protein
VAGEQEQDEGCEGNAADAQRPGVVNELSSRLWQRPSRCCICRAILAQRNASVAVCGGAYGCGVPGSTTMHGGGELEAVAIEGPQVYGTDVVEEVGPESGKRRPAGSTRGRMRGRSGREESRGDELGDGTPASGCCTGGSRPQHSREEEARMRHYREVAGGT